MKRSNGEQLGTERTVNTEDTQQHDEKGMIVISHYACVFF